MKFNKLNSALLFIVAVAIAIIGGLPLITKHSSDPKLDELMRKYDPEMIRHYGLWEAETGAFIAFLVVVAGVTVYYTRAQSIKVQVSATSIVIGLLLLIVFIMRAV